VKATFRDLRKLKKRAGLASSFVPPPIEDSRLDVQSIAERIFPMGR
jgi:hypothetical protein